MRGADKWSEGIGSINIGVCNYSLQIWADRSFTWLLNLLWLLVLHFYSVLRNNKEE